jgi:phenylalanyl-tRNA synthetase beta chain
MLTAFTDDSGTAAGLLRSVAIDQMLRLRNPMQSDRSLLRVSLIPSLIESVAANLKHSSRVQLFELARLYLPNGSDELPNELEALGIVIAGIREDLSVYQSAGDLDFFDVKGVVEALLEHFGICGAQFEPWAHPALHPGRSARIVRAGDILGVLGELMPDVASSFGIGGPRVCVAELDIHAMMVSGSASRGDVRVPRHLPARQDFAIVVDEAVPAGQVAAALSKAAGPLATGVELFDIYRGEQLGDDKKSLAYRVTFTAPDRTLTDDDLVKVRKRIERSLKQDVGGTLRA